MYTVSLIPNSKVNAKVTIFSNAASITIRKPTNFAKLAVQISQHSQFLNAD